MACMRIVIMAAGGLGGYFGARLAAADPESDRTRAKAEVALRSCRLWGNYSDLSESRPWDRSLLAIKLP